MCVRRVSQQANAMTAALIEEKIAEVMRDAESLSYLCDYDAAGKITVSIRANLEKIEALVKEMVG